MLVIWTHCWCVSNAQPSGTISSVEEFCALQPIEFLFTPLNGATAAQWLVGDLPVDVIAQSDTSITLSFDESNVFEVCAVAMDGVLAGDTICFQIGVILPLAISNFEVVCDASPDSFRLVIPISGGHQPYVISSGNGVIVNDTIFTNYFPNGNMTTIFIEDFIGCTNQLFIDSISCDCALEFLPDTIVCQYPFDLFIPDSMRGGAWEVLDPALLYESLNDSLIRFTAGQPGDYQARYFGEINGCFIDDTLSLAQGEHPTVSPVTVDTFCNVGRTHYWVSFSISGGDPSSYLVNGEAISGNSFLSDSIPSGNPFLFVVTDGNGCGADTIIGTYTCECLSAIGNLNSEPKYLCGEDTLFAANYYDPSGQVISGNDVRNYLLVSDTMNLSGSMLQQTINGEFLFQEENMEYGATYFVVLVIGNAGPGDTVLLSDICLVQSASMPVTWFPPLDVAIEASSMEINCNHPQVSIVISSVYDLSTFAFAWWSENGGIIHGDTSAQSIVVADPGDYFVRVYHPFAECDTVASITITQDPFVPVVSIATPDTLTCIDTAILLRGDGSTMGNSIQYSWSGPAILSDPTLANITVSMPGNYVLSLLDTATGCMVIDSIHVVADQVVPRVEAVALGGIGCTFLTTAISGAGSDIGLQYAYQWTSLDSGNIVSSPSLRDIEVDAVGRFRLRVRNVINGCQDSTDVTVDPVDSMIEAFTLQYQQVKCDTPFTGSIKITSVEGGTSPFEYSIDGGQTWSTNMAFQGLTFGQYPVVVRDAVGCVDSSRVILAEPVDFIVDLGDDLFIPLGEDIRVSLMSNLPDSLRLMYEWNPLYDSLRSNQSNQIFQLPIGHYRVWATLTSVNECKASDMLNVYVHLEERVYVPNAVHPAGQEENREFFIFSDPIMVSRITNLHIFDRWGEQVFHRPVWPVTSSYISGEGWNGMIDNEPAHTGVYVYYFDVEFVDGSIHREKGEFILIR